MNKLEKQIIKKLAGQKGTAKELSKGLEIPSRVLSRILTKYCLVIKNTGNIKTFLVKEEI